MNQPIKKTHSHTRFYWLLFLLLSLIFTRYALQIDVPRIVFLAVIAVIAALGSQIECIAIMIALIPLHESVDFYYSIVICLAFYVLKNYRRIRVNLAAVLVLMMIIWELLHCFVANFSIVTFITSIVPLVALAVLMCSYFPGLDYSFIVRILAVTTLALCITILGQSLYWADYNVAEAFTTIRRLGSAKEMDTNYSAILGAAIHPNSLGVICVFVSAGLMQLRTLGHYRRMDSVLIVSLLFFGTLTSSRTFLVCLVLMLFLMIAGQQGSLNQKIRFMGLVASVILLAFLLLSYLFPDLLVYFFGRFQEADITTGRDDLMVAYHKFITGNPRVMLYGIGLQNYGKDLIEVYYVARNVPHNSIQEIVVAWGIPGLFFFAALVFTIIKKSGKHAGHHTLLNYVPLVIILFKSIVGQLLTSGYSMLALSYAYLSLCQNFQVKEQS